MKLDFEFAVPENALRSTIRCEISAPDPKALKSTSVALGPKEASKEADKYIYSDSFNDMDGWKKATETRKGDKG